MAISVRSGHVLRRNTRVTTVRLLPTIWLLLSPERTSWARGATMGRAWPRLIASALAITIACAIGFASYHLFRVLVAEGPLGLLLIRSAIAIALTCAVLCGLIAVAGLASKSFGDASSRAMIRVWPVDWAAACGAFLVRLSMSGLLFFALVVTPFFVGGFCAVPWATWPITTIGVIAAGGLLIGAITVCTGALLGVVMVEATSRWPRMACGFAAALACTAGAWCVASRAAMSEITFFLRHGNALTDAVINKIDSVPLPYSPISWWGEAIAGSMARDMAGAPRIGGATAWNAFGLHLTSLAAAAWITLMAVSVWWKFRARILSGVLEKRSGAQVATSESVRGALFFEAVGGVLLGARGHDAVAIARWIRHEWTRISRTPGAWPPLVLAIGTTTIYAALVARIVDGPADSVSHLVSACIVASSVAVSGLSTASLIVNLFLTFAAEDGARLSLLRTTPVDARSIAIGKIVAWATLILPLAVASTSVVTLMAGATIRAVVEAGVLTAFLCAMLIAHAADMSFQRWINVQVDSRGASVTYPLSLAFRVIGTSMIWCFAAAACAAPYITQHAVPTGLPPQLATLIPVAPLSEILVIVAVAGPLIAMAGYTRAAVRNARSALALPGA